MSQARASTWERRRFLRRRASLSRQAPLERPARRRRREHAGTRRRSSLREHVDLVGSSGALGRSRSRRRVSSSESSTEAALAPEEIAYVGDRVDNDVEPALAAGHGRGPHQARPVGPPARAACRGDRDSKPRRATGRARWLTCASEPAFDAHAFEPGVPLVLGGVAFRSPRGLAGHSDGDVITHALIDALLGAGGSRRHRHALSRPRIPSSRACRR